MSGHVDVALHCDRPAAEGQRPAVALSLLDNLCGGEGALTSDHFDEDPRLPVASDSLEGDLDRIRHSFNH
jgi:hypothetical protein